jgi:hypothetical protein
MPILKMKPHILEVLSLTEEYEDENGDFHKGKEEWVEVSKCDAVPAGQANRITLPDGVELQYSYTIHLPKNVREFLVGEKVRVVFFCEGTLQEKKQFTVKGFHRYQHKSKMWV